MANSLRAKLKKLCHDGKIEQSELDVLLSKLDGHDQQIRNEVINEYTNKLEELIKNGIFVSRNDLFEDIQYIAEQIKERD